jgi:hypothetical protein
MQKLPISRPQFICSVIYLLAVIACIPLAFDFKGSINTTWTLILILLTLPCSLVSILLAWSLIRGAGLEFFAFLYIFFACLNVLWINTIINLSRKNRMAEIEGENQNRPFQSSKE